MGSSQVWVEFARVHGREPDVVAAAPGRVNLVGEHTDYNGGLCLPVALPLVTTAAAALRADGVLTVTSLQQELPFQAPMDQLGPGRTTGWASYAAGVVWALREQGLDLSGLSIVVDGEVPLGAGLSSSASLECAVAMAAAKLGGLDVAQEAVRRDLAQACIRAENEVAGAPTGGMDQTVSLFGQDGHALLIDCRDWSLQQVAWSPAVDGLALCVIDTRASHTLSDGGYGERRAQCEEAARALGVDTLREADVPSLRRLPEPLRRRARHVVTEIARVQEAVTAISAGDSASLGRVFLASHASLRDDFEVSSPELDLVVETATGVGALGARMTGGGFGGSALALLRTGHVAELHAALLTAFAARGWEEPGFYEVPPSAGARLLPAR